MKKTLALIAALTFAVTAFASCGKTDDDSSSKEKSNKESTSSVAEESKADEESVAEVESTADSETASADSETASADADSSKSGDASTTADSAAADSKASDSKSADTSSEDATISLTDSDLDFSGLYSEVEQPSTDPVNAEQSKFLGKWECYCMAADGLAYDSVFGIPLYASLRFEIKDGGKGIVSSLDDFETGSTADEEFTWEFADNQITIYSSSENTFGYLNADGYLVLYSESDPEMFMYFKSVKEYTPFDPSSIEMGFGE